MTFCAIIGIFIGVAFMTVITIALVIIIKENFFDK